MTATPTVTPLEAENEDGPIAISGGDCLGVRVGFRIAAAHPQRVVALGGFHRRRPGHRTRRTAPTARPARSTPSLYLGFADNDQSMSPEEHRRAGAHARGGGHRVPRRGLRGRGARVHDAGHAGVRRGSIGAALRGAVRAARAPQRRPGREHDGRGSRSCFASQLPRTSAGPVPASRRRTRGSSWTRRSCGPASAAWRVTTPAGEHQRGRGHGAVRVPEVPRGPRDLAITDRGLTFATNGERGVLHPRSARPCGGWTRGGSCGTRS